MKVVKPLSQSTVKSTSTDTPRDHSIVNRSTSKSRTNSLPSLNAFILIVLLLINPTSSVLLPPQVSQQIHKKRRRKETTEERNRRRREELEESKLAAAKVAMEAAEDSAKRLKEWRKKRLKLVDLMANH